MVHTTDALTYGWDGAKGPGRVSGYSVPDGTPGTAQTTQVGLVSNPTWGPAADQYPVEHIEFRPNGQ